MPRQLPYGLPLPVQGEVWGALATTHSNEMRQFQLVQWFTLRMMEMRQLMLPIPTIATTARFGGDADLGRAAFGAGFPVHIVVPQIRVAWDEDWPRYCQTFEMVPQEGGIPASITRIMTLAEPRLLLLPNMPEHARDPRDEQLWQINNISRWTRTQVFVLPGWEMDAQGN